MDIQMISFRVADDCVEFVANVPDMAQVSTATYHDPAEYGPAQCRGRLYWDVDEDGPLSALTDEDFERLCQDPSIDWDLDRDY